MNGVTNLLERLHSTVGDTYRVVRELGGGGMSRVFLADDVRLGRQVVIKVLPPEMAAGVNVERFEREIRLAANLQHPHVVPLLSAGSDDDLLYYVMPFIKGESLRAKLAREGELPIGEAVRILRDIADALAYAHREGVVHRDIKPDNVLISDNHAVVTDFGVAKAVSASTGESSLTSLGVALGTPAYMAPEQAAADPHVDHRADIYALGVLAYEMLSGRPPFAGTSPQMVLSAHVTRLPEPLISHRDTVPPTLADLVMRCLAKKPADRWQKAEDLRAQFEAVLTPSGGMTPTGTQPVPAAEHIDAARTAHPVRVTALFGFAAVGVLAVVYVLLLQLGLPNWVFGGAVLLLLIGLPIMLVTGHHERQRVLAQTTGSPVRTPAGLRRHFTWEKAVIGGALAFAGLTLVTGGYMAMRLLGIGPAATLLSAGVLGGHDPIIVADFENRTTDSTLGYALTQTLLIDLARTEAVTLLSPDRIREVLRSMERNPEQPLDATLAREVALREGVKAVLVGDVSLAGDTYLLSLQLISPQNGSVLAAERETAEDAGDVVDAIDRLSRSLLTRIGESLRTIRAREPLGRVTTRSLPALKKYAEGIRAINRQDTDQGLGLLEEAIALDTGFVMAYRKLGLHLHDDGRAPTRARELITHAFERRDRVTEVERLQIEVVYYGYVRRDWEQSAATMRKYADRFPDSLAAWINLGVSYFNQREWSLAENAYFEGIARDRDDGSFGAGLYSRAVIVQVAQGATTRAESTLSLMAQRYPSIPNLFWSRAGLASATGDYSAAAATIRELRAAQAGNLQYRASTGWWLSSFARRSGKLAEAEQQLRDVARAQEQRGLPIAAFSAAAGAAWHDVSWRDEIAQGKAKFESALRRYALDTLPVGDQPYLQLAWFYAHAADPNRARDWMTKFEANTDPARQETMPFRHAVAGAIALAEASYDDAIEATQAWDTEMACPVCALPQLARAYDAASRPDSAIAIYERFLATPWLWRHWQDGVERAMTLKRLGELYEARNDRERAAEYYNGFVELWKEADPDLQPLVRDVRGRIARLVGEVQ